MRSITQLPTIVSTIFGTLAAAVVLAATPSLATPVLPGDDTSVIVVVASTSPTAGTSTSASPSTSPTGSAQPSSTSTTAPTSGSSVSASSAPTSGTTAGPGGEQSIGGVLYVSGLTWVYTPSINPLAGTLDLHFTVRNVSKTTATGSAHMWLNGIFGVTVGQPIDVPVDNLKPGETRVVAGTIGSLSQWTFVNASATFTPPPVLDGVTLTPLTRNTTVWYVPWFMLLVIAILSIALFEVRRRRFAREAEQALLDAATAAAGSTQP
ncbi:MAG: hypothetical protein LWW77_09240 [Propionibacteriales bacterium]|nr:hypothetical protein [Propionibacteriales bacterium]